MSGGRGWQFRFEPNVIKQIEQRAALIDAHEASDRVLTEAQSYFAGPLFAPSNWPERPKDVLERKELQLVLCDSLQRAEQVCALADNSAPQAPIPRRFRLAAPSTWSSAQTAALAPSRNATRSPKTRS